MTLGIYSSKQKGKVNNEAIVALVTTQLARASYFLKVLLVPNGVTLVPSL